MKSIIRSLYGVKKCITEEQALEIARTNVERKGIKWPLPIVVVEHSLNYEVWTAGRSRGALYVVVHIETGKIEGIFGPLSA